MRGRCKKSRRQGFTLLEMVLAGAIGVLLLGALYVAMGVQVRQTQSARDAVEQAKLARSLLERMSQDLAPALGTPDPSRFRASSSSQGGGTSVTGGTGTTGSSTSGTTPSGTAPQGSTSGGTAGAPGTTGATGTTGAGGTSSTSSTTGSATGSSASGSSSSTGGSTASGSSTAASSGTATASGTAVFAVQGDASTLTLFVSRLGRNAQGTDPQAAAAAGTPVPPSDLRRVTYWLIPGGPAGVAGLARQEEPCITTGSDGLAVPDAAGDNQVVAEEVRSLSFSYFDGSSWVDTWDGSAPGSDGMTPTGPPLAIAITIGLVPPGQGEAGEARLKLYRHVVALPTANGATQVLSSADGSTTSGTTGTTP